MVKNQRIAELEAELRRCSDSVYEVAHDWWVALEKLESIGKIVDCNDVDVLVDVVRETRVPDELLQDLVRLSAHYYPKLAKEAQAILNKRKEGE